jgi:heme-degrading monooxygenase HmoA
MSRPVQLHCDLAVDPAKAADAETYFQTVYRPAAMEFEGYIDLRLLRLRAVLAGQAADGANYRFSITFETEELRQKWVASDAHQVVWPALQAFLTSNDFDFLLFEVI